MTSKFREFQKNACTPEVESPPDISDLCPTCVPDPNFIEPDWWTTEQPYLNKKTCEYVTIATVTVDGDIFKHSTISSSGKTFSQILEAYKPTGLNFMLNYFNKERDVEINGRPLLDYVQAKDYHFYSFADSTMVVLISIPAAVFDSVPERPEVVPATDLLQKELTIKSSTLILALKKLKIALGVFSKFQGMHYQLTGQKLIYESTGEPIYLKFYRKRIDKFLSELEVLFERNGFVFNILSPDLNRNVYKIKFDFEFSELEGTYKISGLSGQKRLQRMKKVKKGFNSFKKKFNSDPTLIAFISNILYIDLKIRARKTPSWEEFSSEFIFPKTTLKDKNSSMFTTGIPSLNDHLGKLDDFIFDGIISFSDALIYNLNRSNKTNLRDLNKLPQELDEFGFRLGDISFKFANDRKKDRTKSEFCLAEAIKQWSESGEEYIKDLIENLNPCKLKDLASTVLLCIVGNVEIEVAFLAIIKSTFRNMTSEKLDILLQNLPENIQILIRKEIELQLAGANAEPWKNEYQKRQEEREMREVTIGDYLSNLDDPTMLFGPSFPEEERLTALTLLRESATALLQEEEIFEIYEKAIMKYATVMEIIDSIQNLPGVELLTKFLGVSNFPTTHFVKPPIDSFLNSITFDPCGKEWPSLRLPKVPKFQLVFGWDWLKELGKRFIIALKLTIKQVIVALLGKLASKLTVELPTVGDLFCQGLALNNENPVSDLLTGRGSLGDILADAVSIDTPGQRPDPDETAAAIVESTGISLDGGISPDSKFNIPKPSIQSSIRGPNFDFSRNPERDTETVKNKDSMPFMELVKAISVSSTRDEIIRAITLPEAEQNLNYFRNMANTLPFAVPEFANSVNTVEKVMKFFMDAGAKLSPDQRGFLQDSIQPDDRRQPLEETICLTNEEYRQWEADRLKAFEDSGMDPEVAREFVNKQNERIRSDLDDILDIFANGPDTLLQNAIDRALSDDTCSNPEALITTEGTPVDEIMLDAASSIFKRLQAAFIDDTIEWNFFERLWDSPGILSLILADKKGFTLNYHNSVNDSAILRFFLPNPGDLPETVGIQMFKFLNKSKFSTHDGSTVLTYNNELDEDDLYESTITVKENPNNYNYRVTTESTDSIFSFRVYHDKEQTRGAFYRTFGSIWKGFKINMGNQMADKFVMSVNNIMFDSLLKKCLIRDDGSPSMGFVYSSPVEEITKQDIEYVGPDGEEYDYDEEQGILGRSATNNPRVIFLDPGEHGGSYKKPKYYIEPQKHVGWRGVSKVFVPNTENKGDPLTFLHIPDITKSMQKTMGSLRSDERMHIAPNESPDPPFNKVANSTTIASLEGIITASIRSYLAEFFIRSMPVIANVNVGTNNYDDSMVDFIVQQMQDGFISQTSSRRSIYSGYVYWLLFLEQAAESFDRKYKAYIEKIEKQRENGLSDKMMKLEEELSKYNVNVLKIRAAQENFITDYGAVFEHLQKEVVWSLQTPAVNQSTEIQIETLETLIEQYRSAAETTELGEQKAFLKKIEKTEEEIEDLKEKQALHTAKKKYGDNVVRGSLIMAYGKDYWKWLGLTKEQFRNLVIPSPNGATENQFGFSIPDVITVMFDKIDLKQANFASKIFSIQSVEEHCKQVLKFLVKEQIDYYAPIFEKATEPHIKDINRYFFGSSKVFKFMPSIGTEKETFENIKGCVIDPLKQNPLDGKSFSAKELEDIKKNGYFFFEKYVRIVEKEGSPFINRDSSLKNVVNPKKFMDYLKNNRSLIDETKPISEYFGNPAIKADTIVGSIGIRFGLRLCYAPPDSFIDLPTSQNNLKLAMKEKSFIFKNALVEALPEAVSGAFEIAKENSDEAMLLLTAALPGLGAALALAGVGGDEFEKVIEIVEGLIPPAEFKGSKHIFPVCSFEEDLPDEPMSFYLNSPDENFNQDISCYVDKLFDSKEYNVIFNKMINVKKIPSLLSIYSFTNFLNAIGLDKDEREDSDESQINSNNMGRIFNDTKKELKKLFIQTYKRSNFDPPDDDNREDQTTRSKNKKMQSTLDHVVMSKEIPWFSKLNKVMDNPLLGFAFGNPYTKMFDLIETEED